jgi:hypothetical protein
MAPTCKHGFYWGCPICKSLLAIALLALFTSPAFAQKQLPPKAPMQLPPRTIEPILVDYQATMEQAAKAQWSVIVFVGIEQRTINGALSCKVKSLSGFPAKCIAVAVPDNQGWMTTAEQSLPTTATDAEIIAAMRAARQAVSQSATRFTSPSSNQFAAPTADGDAANLRARLPFLNERADALDEVNARRAAKGLRPFLKDEGLTQAAYSAASYRAARLITGHDPNGDFRHVPTGSFANYGGCAAWHGTDWGSCCSDEDHTYAGAAWVRGADNRRYMHLFVRTR